MTPVTAAMLLRQWLCTRVHDLGPRVLYELLEELDRYHALDADLDRRLERYAELDPGLLRAVGANKFAARPLHLAGGRPR
jgi:hypothetical protein